MTAAGLVSRAPRGDPAAAGDPSSPRIRGEPSGVGPMDIGERGEDRGDLGVTDWDIAGEDTDARVRDSIEGRGRPLVPRAPLRSLITIASSTSTSTARTMALPTNARLPNRSCRNLWEREAPGASPRSCGTPAISGAISTRA